MGVKKKEIGRHAKRQKRRLTDGFLSPLRFIPFFPFFRLLILKVPVENPP